MNPLRSLSRTDLAFAEVARARQSVMRRADELREIERRAQEAAASKADRGLWRRVQIDDDKVPF